MVDASRIWDVLSALSRRCRSGPRGAPLPLSQVWSGNPDDRSPIGARHHSWRDIMSMKPAEGAIDRSRIAYQHPAAFRFGLTAVTVGVLLHLPFYYSARHDHYRLVGRTPDASMMFGMALIVIGLAATFYGLFPKLSTVSRGYVSRIKVRALDDAPISPAHIGLLVVMAAAITIDVMKPTTLAFIAPGAAKEYGLRSPLNPHAHALPIALYALCGIGGTVIGSFLWGWFGDKIGRRASILLAGVIFIAVAACGAMPAYWANLIVCFT